MLNKQVKVLTASDDLLEFLENHPSHVARVHSVFHHATNLLNQAGELITLTNLDDITPMGLVVDYGISFSRYLKMDDEVTLDIDRITAVNGEFTLILRDAEVWKTSPLLNLVPHSGDEIAEIRSKLMKLVAKQPPLGLLPLLSRLTDQPADLNPIDDNLYSRYIADDLAAFTQAIAASSWEHALNIANRLIGFGMGSTPSCDDFLAAYMVIFKMAEAVKPGHYPWVRGFNKAISDKAKKRTTLISANMLRHASDGKICRSHQHLIQACLYQNKSDLASLTGQVMQHGASSGGDFLLGLVCALEWYRNSMADNPKKGEQAWVGLKGAQPVPSI
ncbi:MAG TPA: DUF2877 domain-containing protein [Anaerolineaceae bacterium]|nr:DUF2877 domain-containing protein [Anaerolineaceae bacterium]